MPKLEVMRIINEVYGIVEVLIAQAHMRQERERKRREITEPFFDAYYYMEL